MAGRMRTYEHVIRAPVSRERAFDWWSDYSEEDHTGEIWEGFGEGTRTVLERDDEGARIRDTFDGHAIVYEVRFHPPERIVVEGTAKELPLVGDIPFSGEFVFDPIDDGGVEITARGSIEPQGLLERVTEPFWIERVVDTIKADLDLHAEELAMLGEEE